MGLRLTTWNVNGIRNPFGHPPWRDQRTFTAMFDILEADIVVFQETKIQRKDLRDDMVLVPGWDCYWSLPRHKKGYSGVVVYTRQSQCAPIRAEEGITGVLCPPNSTTSFRDLAEEQQVGGYPTPIQLSASVIDPATIDSEGRCVILEFPAFVLLGVYSPATRDESRDDFRIGFLNLLDARIRNLELMGKRVILMGDLNISASQIDTANPEASMRKSGMTAEEWISTPSRRLFNHLLHGGNVEGEKDKGRERQILWDTCRGFHPARTGMFTCWEQKVNARPGNHGARIDYVLCSLAMRHWFSDSNIQEGLMGSDHCPVYATFKDRVENDGREVFLVDLMNPVGMFENGQRQREYSAKDILPLSGRLIPEFDGRRNIRDMFARKASMQSTSGMMSSMSGNGELTVPVDIAAQTVEVTPLTPKASSQDSAAGSSSNVAKASTSVDKKRPLTDASGSKTSKKAKPISTISASAAVPGKGQQSLKDFLKPKATTLSGALKVASGQDSATDTVNGEEPQPAPPPQASVDLGTRRNKATDSMPPATHTPPRRRSFVTDLSPSDMKASPPSNTYSSSFIRTPTQSSPQVHDPVASAESWSKLFTKPAAPRCEGHDEPCITLLTKKSGMNCGRSFWMCARPLGPSGAKEKNTQWRCQTFIWCSDWNPASAQSMS